MILWIQRRGSEEFTLYEELGNKSTAETFRSEEFWRGDREGERRWPPPCCCVRLLEQVMGGWEGVGGPWQFKSLCSA